MDGFVIINKDKGMTSYDVCHKIKKIFKTSKVGHTGTLDPNTTGVLVVAVNKATKLMPLLLEHTKEYETTVLFGKSTDTLDITGKVIIEELISRPLEEDIDLCLEKLKKTYKQIPPIYSSIKVNGKKLYQYARNNEIVKVEERDIKIYDLVRKSNVYEIDGYFACDLYMKTSKGFYVRSLCRDLGDLLGIPSLMLELNRISSGDFHISKSVKLNEDLANNLLSIEDVFIDNDKLEVNDYIAKLVLNGVVLDERQIETNKNISVYNKDKLIAIYYPYEEYKYKPVVIFND